MPHGPPAFSHEPVSDDAGVDVTLIRWMLSLTPAERLDTLQAFVNAVTAIREQNAGL